jgi:hypothetical protein
MAIDAALSSRLKCYYFEGNRYLRMTQPGSQADGEDDSWSGGTHAVRSQGASTFWI